MKINKTTNNNDFEHITTKLLVFCNAQVVQVFGNNAPQHLPAGFRLNILENVFVYHAPPSRVLCILKLIQCPRITILSMRRCSRTRHDMAVVLGKGAVLATIFHTPSAEFARTHIAIKSKTSVEIDKGGSTSWTQQVDNVLNDIPPVLL